MRGISFEVNGQAVTVDLDPARPLLDVLREDLGLTGTKQGCDHEGECGACTVLLDGEPVRSCLTPVGKVAGCRVGTVEGLAGFAGLHPLQIAFIERGAVQCGYCTPGMLLAAKALLDRQPDPTETQIIEALEGNLCRCTGYVKIVDAVKVAARRLRGEPDVVEAPRPRQAIGGSELRSDSVAKVTGLARYVEDISMPGMLHLAVLRSPHHHARLVRLDAQAATCLPGVVRVLTAGDIPGENGLGDYSQEEPVLVPLGATVRMVGAPVGLVIAESPLAARAALGAIRVSYDVLPHTFELEEALRPGAVHIAGRDNLLTRYEVKHGDLDAAFDASDVIVEGEYHTAYLEHGALEREALLGYLDEAGRITVAGGSHEPYFQQRYIANALGLQLTQVRVITPPTGGSFGGKQDPWPFIATALAVYHVRRPVRLVYSRQESFACTPKRHPYTVRNKVGATRDGRLTGIWLRIDANTGAYDAAGQYIPNYAVTASGGPYRWRAVDASARAVYTNGPKAGQFRGFGTAQSAFATECALDELAEKLEIDPLAFRLKNRVTWGEPSFLGYPVGESLGFEEVLKALQLRYDICVADAATFNADGGPCRRGVGLAGMWYRFGKSGSLRVEAHAELTPEGRFVIYCTAADYGQGTNTTMSQMAAEGLGVPRERITLVNADTALAPDSGIQGASRATYFVGGAVTAATANLKAEILGTAAEVLDLPPGSLAIRDGLVVEGTAPHSKTVTLAEIAKEFDRIGKPRRVRGFFDLSAEFPESRPSPDAGSSTSGYAPIFITGAHLAEVEVDMSTGQARVLCITAAHDVGRVVNRRDAEGQIEGAVLMGLGAALMEEYLPGHTTTFGDYYLPTAKSMPAIDVILVEVPSLYGPLGVKGLGEASMLPATPAIINAISRAIGSRLRTIPATPERVLAAIKGSLRPPSREGA